MSRYCTMGQEVKDSDGTSSCLDCQGRDKCQKQATVRLENISGLDSVMTLFVAKYKAHVEPLF